MADDDYVHELPEHEGSFTVAGYNFFGGDWNDVERGDTPLEDIGLDYITDVERVTVHYVNPQGDDIYYTVHGPFDDWESFVSQVEYDLDPYAVA